MLFLCLSKIIHIRILEEFFWAIQLASRRQCSSYESAFRAALLNSDSNWKQFAAALSALNHAKPLPHWYQFIFEWLSARDSQFRRTVAKFRFLLFLQCISAIASYPEFAANSLSFRFNILRGSRLNAKALPLCSKLVIARERLPKLVALFIPKDLLLCLRGRIITISLFALASNSVLRANPKSM